MMNTEVWQGIILNIGLLVVIAQILSRLNIIKQTIFRQKINPLETCILILIFGGIGILSTSIGYNVSGSLANTRVIGIMAASYIGGPLVGVGASVIAGVHRYLIDINGLTAVACMVSTMVGGCIAAYYSKAIREHNFKETHLFLLTAMAELVQMVIILTIARPFEAALELVSVIVLPMVIINAFGMVLFLSVFKHMFIQREYEYSEKINVAFNINKKCLPIVSTGIYDADVCKKISRIILEYSNDLGVIFTDTKEVISSKGKMSLKHFELPQLSKQIIDTGHVCVAEKGIKGDSLETAMEKTIAIGGPLIKNNEVFGTFIIFTDKYKLSYDSETQFVEGLSELLSVQYELSELEKQKDLLLAAEFKALQSQINPHFIFNSLNTISAFCREKPEKARDLLINLSTYFRNSIQNQEGMVSLEDELLYVNSYIQLEQARFEDKLEIKVDIIDNMEVSIPCLILQPIVENAITHGAMKRKKGQVHIIIKKFKKFIRIDVKDNGYGISKDTLRSIEEGSMDKCIGLRNVHQRLKHKYGQKNGLKFQTSDQGTTVSIYIPY